jgi:hypothetical protein
MTVTCTNTIVGSYSMPDKFAGTKIVWGKGDVTTCGKTK